MNKLFSLFLVFFLAACTTDHGSYSVISSAPMNLYTLTTNNTIVAEQVSGQDSQFNIFFIPLNQKPKLDDIIEKLVQKHNGDYMSNVTIEYKTLVLMSLYQQMMWKVTGDVVRVHK